MKRSSTGWIPARPFLVRQLRHPKPLGGGHQTSRGCPALERKIDQLADGGQLWVPVPGGASLSTKILEGPRRLAAGTG